ncbi:carbon starvation CstA family protein [Clostridium frigidicarnis]|uniref:Carbon starvation protein n=1 Tax=Clostridium frigidicarnis TaxID=84698 RepID=A0A1I1ADI9_9CLOT|nr:carbon starvation protein A [Clostridium frigidicarnis]SFB35416.1 carbon starvation protein [Clostridium frigidicarnis]
MSAIVLLVGAVVIFIVAYLTYGSWLAKKWGIDLKRETPAHTKFDNVDYVPADARILLGHHFSSIAGAGPITGPIVASVFGWLPVYLWILLGSIFVGGVHDFGALFASIRHDGKSIGEIIHKTLGKKGKLLFNIFAWATLTLVVAAFTDICAGSFAYNAQDPTNLAGAQAGTASMLFIILAVCFGFFVNKKGKSVGSSTVIGVTALFLCIWIGYIFPVIKLSKGLWMVVLIIYIAAASILPVWILLQPRDYLCSFLLYSMLVLGIVGILFSKPNMQIPAFQGFINSSGETLFPFLFVTVACGAVSGFHSLIGSGTSSKQINKEGDAKLIGYGAMLIEGIVAVVALIAVGAFAKSEGAPATVFANGIANFMNSFGVPIEIGRVFILLTFSAFALTSLDSATRIGRYIFQETFSESKGKVKEICTNKWFATLITIAVSGGLTLYGYNKIWPIFGAANQLLAALALLALSAWLLKIGRKYAVALIPMVFMFIVTITALVILIYQNLFTGGSIVLGILGLLLLIVAALLLREAYNQLIRNRKSKTA